MSESIVLDKSFIPACAHSVAVILITEIGDKTFFIAAVLAMRYGRIFVYSGAMSALAIMHVLSVVMGYALPNLLPRAYTHFISSVLFLYFGCKLLRDSYFIESSGPSDELLEVEEELIKKKEDSETSDSHIDGSSSNDSNSSIISSTGDIESAGDGSKVTRIKNSTTSMNLKVFTQALTLTFLAEWGDRSQIATIALAATKNPMGVIVGGLIGHAFCTGLAVIGGRLLAARISEKHVALVGGVSFLLFALHGFMFGVDN
mmetsp:Transcript_13680/g.12392  ORF Transcript_13680/g.12392 Transcript_13680/m.12392 type:complete len:259 (+) Transcript_13680:78-854(+)